MLSVGGEPALALQATAADLLALSALGFSKTESKLNEESPPSPA